MNLETLRISEKKLDLLYSMKIHSVEELLTHYPFRYEENEQKPFDAWEKEERVCFEAKIISLARVSRYGYKKSTTRFAVLYDNVELTITLFNRPWTSAFPLGKTISIFGKYDGNYKVTCMNYNAQPLQEQLGLIPVYSVKDGLTQKDMRKYIDNAFSVLSLPDFIPSDYKQKYRLLSREKALYQIHKPQDREQLKQALRTLKYEEFLKFQLQMQHRKSLHKEEALGIAKQFDRHRLEAFIKTLPFALTEGQQEAVDAILHDLRDSKTMYRLVQGDVGCGKTLVALLGMYACVLAGKQAAMMAPTEILAKQHGVNLKRYLEKEEVRVEVLYSAMPKKAKEEVLAGLRNGEIDIIVGTHALFQKEVEYANLGMVVADEQHRFGVEQRRQLLEKGEKVDFLLMSATPIPRTLAVSLYGDMDVSTITQLPQGRKTIATTFVEENSLRTVLEEILQRIDEGEQCYIVCPAIEKNEEYEIRNVETLYKDMNAVLGRKYKLGLLHGKMSSEEKEKIMQDFLHKKYQMLITTTVIEVGVDVKDANIMVIYDAHRFGMSQLHQLRGRVGRGERQGYCYLLSGSKEQDAKERLRVVASTNDGFMIAQKDLALRGPGDLLGIRQSGVSGFLLGDVIADENILEVSRQDAQEILSHLAKYPQVVSFLAKKDYTSYVD